jgi:hypothetical protein
MFLTGCDYFELKREVERSRSLALYETCTTLVHGIEGRNLAHAYFVLENQEETRGWVCRVVSDKFEPDSGRHIFYVDQSQAVMFIEFIRFFDFYNRSK